MNTNLQAPAVIRAVRDRLSKIDSERAEADLEEERMRSLYEQARAKREAIDRDKGDLLGYLESVGAEPDRNQALADLSNAVKAAAAGDRSRVQDLVIPTILDLLSDGRRMKLPSLVAALEARGALPNTLNRSSRVSQILSLDSRFESDRTTGWGMRVAQ